MSFARRLKFSDDMRKNAEELNKNEKTSLEDSNLVVTAAALALTKTVSYPLLLTLGQACLIGLTPAISVAEGLYRFRNAFVLCMAEEHPSWGTRFKHLWHAGSGVALINFGGKALVNGLSGASFTAVLHTAAIGLAIKAGMDFLHAAYDLIHEYLVQRTLLETTTWRQIAADEAKYTKLRQFIRSGLEMLGWGCILLGPAHFVAGAVFLGLAAIYAGYSHSLTFDSTLSTATCGLFKLKPSRPSRPTTEELDFKDRDYRTYPGNPSS
jgi:hypothetical protein